MLRIIFGCFIAASFYAPVLAVGQPSPTEPAATVRANADLVVVDVVVTDAKQNPVHNLTETDFTLLENGHAETIKDFEEHIAGEAAKLSALPKLDPGTFTNYSPTPASSALNILLLDKLNTPMKDQAYVLAQVLKYLKEARPSTRIAIFGLTSQLRLLQGFTSDPDLLRAALNAKKGALQGSPLLNDPMSGDSPGADDPMMDLATSVLGNSPDGATLLANLQQFQAEQQSFQLQLRTRYTLDAFNQLGRYLSRLPGRKNLIWFSGSFPISILPDGDLENPFGVDASFEDEFRETTNLLSRSQVAVYPIDARGLMTAPMINAANSGGKYAKSNSAYLKDNATFSQQTAAEHGTMMQLAEATGGKAFVDTNGLKEAVEKAVEAGSNYYTLTYTPTNREWKGEYRKIQIKLSLKGLNLAYRRGYYADDSSAPVHHGEPKSASADLAPYNAMRAAMLRGGPDPTQIIFEANVRPSVADAEPGIAQGNKGSPKMTGPYRRYTVYYTAAPKDVSCDSTPDGVRHCLLEFVTVVYDADGAFFNSQSNGIKIAIPAARYTAILHGGFQYRQEISVPVKGDYFLRIGIHDLTTDHVGAIELPVSAVSKLPPLATQAPAPASTATPK
jgi:VWFA-related protein